MLTSLSDSDLAEVGICGNVLSQVLRLGALARTAGCGGLVASALEARELRRELGEGFAIVTPGVRPAGAAAADQARVVTPHDAIAAGSTTSSSAVLSSTRPTQPKPRRTSSARLQRPPVADWTCFFYPLSTIHCAVISTTRSPRRPRSRGTCFPALSIWPRLRPPTYPPSSPLFRINNLLSGALANYRIRMTYL